jgi:hypothetical protein
MNWLWLSYGFWLKFNEVFVLIDFLIYVSLYDMNWYANARIYGYYEFCRILLSLLIYFDSHLNLCLKYWFFVYFWLCFMYSCSVLLLCILVIIFSCPSYTSCLFVIDKRDEERTSHYCRVQRPRCCLLGSAVLSSSRVKHFILNLYNFHGKQWD